jgi:phage terminase small subunit
LTDREKAKVLYLSGKKVVEIASELDIKEGTLRSWKSRGKWPARLQRKNATKKQSIARGNTTFDNDDSGVSEQQKKFCLYYVKFFNATQAAINAGYAKTSAHVEGCRLLKNDKVRAEIKRLKSAMAAELFVEAEDILMLYFKIAFGDIGEYVTFGRRDVQVMSAFGPVYEGKGNMQILSSNGIDPSTVGVIQLVYGDRADEFANMLSMSVDPATQTLNIIPKPAETTSA